MKKFYLLFFIFSVSHFRQSSFAQCTCSDGSTPDSIKYNERFDSIVTTNTTISFPQFDPSIGVLTCFRLTDTVSTIVRYNLENDLPDTTVYNFETFRRSQFTGPGSFFSSVTSTPKDFGPYTLSPKDSAGDNVDIGPDTVFNKKVQVKYGGSNSAFYGTGTVSFSYLNTSTFTILTGSDNAIFTLKAYTRLNAELVYYWCPIMVLETRLTGFTTSLANNDVLVQWMVDDPNYAGRCEVEMSTDGRNFTNLGEGISSLSSGVSNFKLLYTPSQNFTGNLFFRIKQTGNEGKISYSEIHSVVINNKNKATYSLYPNPAVTGLNIQFANKTGGQYEVELFNSIGQSNFRKKYSLNQASAINIEWPSKPTPGIYYLKVRDLGNKTEQVERVQIL